jgi:hypothetical protein
MKAGVVVDVQDVIQAAFAARERSESRCGIRPVLAVTHSKSVGIWAIQLVLGAVERQGWLLYCWMHP